MDRTRKVMNMLVAQNGWANPAGAVDAPIPSLFHVVRRVRRATDQRRWAKDHHH